MLAFSSYSALAQAPSGAPQWNGVDGNEHYNWDYVQQNQITPSNVKDLQINWVYPIPALPSPYATSATEGTIVHTPIIVNGISYAITEYHLLLAQNLKDGSIIWRKELPYLKFININTVTDPGFNITGHYHAIWYTSNVRGTPLIWIVANNYTIFAYNALNGDLNLQFNMFNPRSKVPGNFGLYGSTTPQIVIDEKRNILVGGVAVSEGVNSARGFYAAYDISQTPPKFLWRTFLIPPQDGSDPNWAISSVQNMSHAYIFDGKTAVDLKALPTSQLHDLLYNDWGNFGFNGTRSFAGAATAWGGSGALDLNTGMMYLGTAQPSPDFNATTRPGPNLWSDAILALDDTTGKISWAFQTTTHDIEDWDCSWSVMLANSTINGQTHETVFKGCKNGYVYALDASTGHMYWVFDAPSIKRLWKPIDPLNANAMKINWQNQPSTKAYLITPFFGGAIESDPSYDPVTNTVFVATYNLVYSVKPCAVTGKTACAGYYAEGIDFNSVTTVPNSTNTTVWAIDANTGQAKWHYFIDGIGYRGGISVSNGVLFVPRNDGVLDMLDASSGNVLASKLIGGAMITQPAIAADANGNVKIVMPASGPSTAGMLFGVESVIASPGFMFALGLGPSSTKTLTTTVLDTGTSGVDPTTFYSLAGVTAIFAIATGILAVRRRRPAS